MAESEVDRLGALPFAISTIISSISERNWCAGWMGEIEFSLWRDALNRDEPQKLKEATQGEARALFELACLASGWVVYEVEGDGETFVPMPEWEKRYAAHEVTKERA